MRKNSILTEMESVGKDLKLNTKNLQKHYERFLAFKENGFQNHKIKVKEFCNLQNARILPYEKLQSFPKVEASIASFVPAAGASTRYLEPLYKAKNLGDLQESKWVLPKNEKGGLLPLEEMLQLPKALYPCVEEMISFFEMKLLEIDSIPCVKESFFVIPPGKDDRFKNSLEKYASERKSYFLEQGADLSTLRLNSDGEPVVLSGKSSTVPAGHGALIQLWPQVMERVSDETQSLFIRNIDNVIGTKGESVEATNLFLNAHNYLLKEMNSIRSSLELGDFSESSKLAESLLEKFSMRVLSKEEVNFLSQFDREQKILLHVLLSIFHTPFSLLQEKSLLELYQRPLNFLGQVSNSGKDRGGCPVLAEFEGQDFHLCLEQAHFRGEDQKRFLSGEDQSFFNPVFVVSELQRGVYYSEDHPFWIFAEKNWYGKTVYYHESLLYEILGNSLFANLVFVEVPRAVFNPHKSLEDTMGKSRAMYC